jgi:hypothetical protein
MTPRHTIMQCTLDKQRNRCRSQADALKDRCQIQPNMKMEGCRTCSLKVYCQTHSGGQTSSRHDNCKKDVTTSRARVR